MELSRLQVFLTVMDSRNFAKAADIMGMSQPAISKNIKKLEDHLDVKLFDRGRYGAEPTKYAEAIERRAKLLLNDSRLIEAEIDALRDSRKGQLRIGCSPPFLPIILPEALSVFRRRWPNIHLEVSRGLPDTLSRDLDRGEFDFILSIPPMEVLNDENVNIKLAYKSERKLVMRNDHPLSRLDSFDLEQLSLYPWISACGLGDWREICGLFLMKGLKPPKLALETTSENLAKGLLEYGDFICILDSSLFAADEKLEILMGLSNDILPEPNSAYLTYRRRQPLSTAAVNMISVITAIKLHLH